MKQSPVRIIWRKELRDTIRDRKTLLSMIIMPLVLMPAILVGMGRYTAWQTKQAADKPVTVGLVEAEPLPDLKAALAATPKLELTTLTGDPKTALTNKEIDVALIIPAGTATKVATAEPVSLPLLTKSTNAESPVAASRVATTVAAYSAALTSQRLTAAGINPSILSPVTLKPEDISSQQEMAGYILGFILPMFVVVWAIAGGQYTAIDVSAGEKERKTLEALLLTPARRIDIVTGKFLAVATVSAISVILAITSLYISLKYAGIGSMSGTNIQGAAAAVATLPTDLNISIQPAAVVLMLIVGLLTVAVFSSVMLSIAIFANSYKEAQSYIGPAYLVVVLPIILLNSLSGVTVPLWVLVIPAANGVALFKEVLLGSYDPLHIAVTIISLVIFSFIALYIAARIYQKEKVLILS